MLHGSASPRRPRSRALAFGPLIEQAGVSRATSVAMASAMFGISTAGLLAGTSASG